MPPALVPWRDVRVNEHVADDHGDERDDGRGDDRDEEGEERQTEVVALKRLWTYAEKRGYEMYARVQLALSRGQAR